MYKSNGTCWGPTWARTLSRRCLRSSWCRMEGLWLVSVKAPPPPTGQEKTVKSRFGTEQKRDNADISDPRAGWEIPLRPFRWWTAFLSTVSLSSLRVKGWQAGIMADSSSMRLFILSLRRFSICRWGSLWRICKYNKWSQIYVRVQNPTCCVCYGPKTITLF